MENSITMHTQHTGMFPVCLGMCMNCQYIVHTCISPSFLFINHVPFTVTIANYGRTTYYCLTVGKAAITMGGLQLLSIAGMITIANYNRDILL